MTTTTPRRAQVYTHSGEPRRRLTPPDPAPRRRAAQHAALCRDYYQHWDCGDNGLHVRGQWMADLDEYGDEPRRAVFEGPWVVTEGWAS